MRDDAIYRLIEIKDEELSGLRMDLERLDQLVEDAQARFESARNDQKEFLEQIRTSAESSRLVVASGMMEQRNFLAHLYQKSKNAEQIVEEATRQRDYAQRALEKAYVEKKSFELLAERKRFAWQFKQTRQQFLMADDEELVRAGRTRQLHGEH